MDLYSEIILDYYKNPRNKVEIKNPNHSASEDNPLCGDKIIIQLKTENGKITEAGFMGEGCAISQASTSMLLEKVIGKSVKEAKELSKEDIYEMLGIQISPGRTKCALLGLSTLRQALKN